jgi:phosphoribosylanthranilate isomerase
MDQKIKLKVCGLRDNILDVAGLAPDYLGFIFYQKSPRFVGEDFQMPEIRAGIKKVGVFVNEDVSAINYMVAKHGLDLVQLHGDESPADCQFLHEKGISIIKAFAMEEGFDFERLMTYEDFVDYFLFDTKTKRYGGSGSTFNWEILEKYSSDKMYFLSGGLSLENIHELKSLDVSKVHALDVNSRFEIEPGLKDITQVKKLINEMWILNNKIQLSNNK